LTRAQLIPKELKQKRRKKYKTFHDLNNMLNILLSGVEVHVPEQTVIIL